MEQDDGLWCSCSLRQCRICHEEEDEAFLTTMESPCACSGSLKYAHRGCVQRWCDEKGNTLCEICLQFTVVLLLRHLVAMETIAAAEQSFSLLIVYLLKASGVLLPLYVVMRLISAVQHGQMQYRLQRLQEQRSASRLHRVLGQGEQHHMILVG